MWSAPVVTSAAAVEPLLVEDAKVHVEFDGTHRDDYIEGLTKAARAYVESYTGTRLITQTLTLRASCWDDLATLPVAPVQSITSITYTDTAGDSQTLATTVYEARLYGLAPTIVLKYNQTWPTIREGSLIVVVAVVGYGAAGSNCPQEVIHALRLIVGDMLAFRETAQVGSIAGAIPASATVDALLVNHRMWLP